VAVSRALRRLFHIRALEEEQSKMALDSSLAHLRQVENAHRRAFDAVCQGRRLLESGVRSGDLPDRLAGIEEIRRAQYLTDALVPMMAEGEADVAEHREDFLLTRVHRRQAETLIDETEKLDAEDADRRAQQALGDWYLNRLQREKAK